MTLSPYLISLQRLAAECDLRGFRGLGTGANRLLIQETLKAWMESRGHSLTPDPQTSLDPQEPPAQTSLEENQ